MCTARRYTGSTHGKGAVLLGGGVAESGHPLTSRAAKVDVYCSEVYRAVGEVSRFMSYFFEKFIELIRGEHGY